MRATKFLARSRVLAALAAMVALALSLSGCFGDKDEDEKDESLVKSGVAAVVGGAVATTKEAVSGISQGVEEGRKSGQSLDDAVIVTSKEDFAANAAASVLKVEDLGQGAYQITIGFKNDLEKPVRLSSLFQETNMILLDAEGFAYRDPKHPGLTGEITVLPKASERVRVTFENVELKPKILRLYQADYELPEPVSAAAEAEDASE